MVNLTIGIGLLLALLGIGGYVLTGMVSPTALIPAAFGIVLLMIGFYARAAGQRRTAMHLAMGIAVVGIIGSIGGLLPAIQWLSGSPIERPAASVSRSVMAVTLAVYLWMGIRSFIAARAK